MTVRFTQTWDIDTEAHWRSQKLSNGQFDYWVFIKLLYIDACMPDSLNRYDISLIVVAPGVMEEEHKLSALEGLGLDNDAHLERAEQNPEAMAGLLVEAGMGVTVWSGVGDNKSELLKQARKEAQLVEMLFGFYMDKPVNMIGTTGWDWLRGDILAGMTRRGQ